MQSSQWEGMAEDPDMSALLSEKETLETAISNSHSCHLERILKLGDETLERESKTAEKLAIEARELEYNRNRQRVAEIFDLYELQKHDISNLQSGDDMGS